MPTLLLALIVWLVGGIVAWVLSGIPRISNLVGLIAAVTGCLMGLPTPIDVLFLDAAPVPLIDSPWLVPGGAWNLSVDALSAWFLLPVLVCGAAVCLAASGWMSRNDHPRRRTIGRAWLLMTLLLASIVILLTARNIVVWLISWQVITFALYFLHETGRHTADQARAANVSLYASQLGTSCLIPVLLLLGGSGDVLQFTPLAPLPGTGLRLADVLFLLAVIGFGTRATLLPLGAWSPGMACTAPSYLPALSLSLVCPLAVYGLLRCLSLLGPPPLWWALVLIGLGIVSGPGGLLLAQCQSDLRRSLAYCTSANLGLVHLGLGIGLLGYRLGSTTAAVLGLAGALYHVWHLAVVQTLLTLCTGAVERSTGTADLDHLGGLMRRMPLIGCCVCFGSVAHCSLPPLSGFVGEFLMLLSAFEEELLAGSAGTIPALAVIGVLGWTGGLAVAQFTRLFGIPFLGTPRSDAVGRATAVPWTVCVAAVLLCAVSLALALAAPRLLPFAEPVVGTLPVLPQADVATALVSASAPLIGVQWVFGTLLGVGATVMALRAGLGALLPRTVGETWNGGDALADPRTQPTASSYVRAQSDLYRWLMPVEPRPAPLDTPFPEATSMAPRSAPGDIFLRRIFEPLAHVVARFCASLHGLQPGPVNVHLMSMAITLVILLTWFVSRS